MLVAVAVFCQQVPVDLPELKLLPMKLLGYTKSAEELPWPFGLPIATSRLQMYNAFYLAILFSKAGRLSTLQACYSQ